MTTDEKVDRLSSLVNLLNQRLDGIRLEIKTLGDAVICMANAMQARGDIFDVNPDLTEEGKENLRRIFQEMQDENIKAHPEWHK